MKRQHKNFKTKGERQEREHATDGTSRPRFNMPVMPGMCATCPFRDGSPYKYLQDDLTVSALNQASRICHSTGGNNAINKRTGKPERLCRGARDIQLKVFKAIGFIKEETDAAWDARRKELGV